MSTDSWKKMQVFQDFLESQGDQPKAIWRNKQKLKPETLAQFPPPINLYFFHRNYVGYRAHCVDIKRGTRSDWALELTPPAYHNDMTEYTMGIFLDRIESVPKTHIREFPKWDNPTDYYDAGQLGLLRVQDALESWRGTQ